MDPEEEMVDIEPFTWDGGDGSNIVSVQGELSDPVDLHSVWP